MLSDLKGLLPIMIAENAVSAVSLQTSDINKKIMKTSIPLYKKVLMDTTWKFEKRSRKINVK
jgi:hypothetical protein